MAKRKTARAKGKTDLSLKRYRAKRDFTLTKEPAGRKARQLAGELSYLIQKHAARRLHYDFRLELDGVLKSWAVTRGPSLNPADKRLAVHVEDHPLDYGTFEGTIPQGQYGGGTVMLWDRGTWEPIDDPHAGLAKGHLRFKLKGERLKGEWHLVRMKGNRPDGAKHDNWLLIKIDDEYADRKFDESSLGRYRTSVASGRSMQEITGESGPRKTSTKPASKKNALPKKPARKTALPEFVELQLALLVAAPPASADWVHEIKFDGYRALARVNGGDVKLLTRNNNDWTKKFQIIADELSSLSLTNVMLDGEIVTVDEQGEMSFSNLQQALSGNTGYVLHYYVFDLLFENGEDIRALPLIERKKRLQKLLPRKHPHIHLSEHFTEAGKDVLEHSCSIGLEGIISKQKNAPYRAGRHGGWLKEKCVGEQEMVIGGFAYQPEHPGQLGSLLIGYYENGQLRFAGKVGTGFTEGVRADLLDKLLRRTQKSPPFADMPKALTRGVVWVRPDLVGQIHFTEWTKDGKLRHPAFKGLREDKKAKEVQREEPQPIDKIAESPPAAKARPRFSSSQPVPADITRPEKILYPEDGITKGEIAAYYQAVAPLMLPHIVGRPLSLLRCPNGVGATCFFQRHAGEHSPSSIKNIVVDISGKHAPYLWIDGAEGLMALVQLGCLEIHNWPVKVDRLDHPDLLIFDLDPGETVAWKLVVQAATEIRQRLERLKLKSFLKSTGGKGLHVVIPLGPGTGWETLRNFAKKIADEMAADQPRLYTANSRKIEREGRIYIDYVRNTKGASAIAPFSTRARPGGNIAMPVSWAMLPKLKSGPFFTIRNAAAQIRKDPKPWEGFNRLKQKLPISS